MEKSLDIDYRSTVIASTKGLIAAIISALAVSLIASGVLIALPDPTSLLLPLSLLALFISFIVGGIFSSISSDSPLISALIYIAAHLIVILICSFILGGEESNVLMPLRVFIYLGAALSAVISSLIYSKMKRGKRKTRARSKRYKM